MNPELIIDLLKLGLIQIALGGALMAGLMVIQSFGYPVTGVIASLGIGGLAFALAAKDTLSNIFGSLMIIFDRPFHIGDWVKDWRWSWNDG